MVTLPSPCSNSKNRQHQLLLRKKTTSQFLRQRCSKDQATKTAHSVAMGWAQAQHMDTNKNTQHVYLGFSASVVQTNLIHGQAFCKVKSYVYVNLNSPNPM